MRLVILGAGGYGQTIADIARQSKRYSEILFLDDNAPETDGKLTYYSLFINEGTVFYPAFGNNECRMSWLKTLVKASCNILTLVHDTAYVSPTTIFHPGVVVLPMAVVNTDCVLYSGCIVNCGAVVDHGCVLEEGVHVSLNAVVKSENRIPRCVKIDAGQVVENRMYPL